MCCNQLGHDEFMARRSVAVDGLFIKHVPRTGPGEVADENNRPRQIERECVRVWSCRCEATHHYVVIGR